MDVISAGVRMVSFSYKDVYVYEEIGKYVSPGKEFLSFSKARKTKQDKKVPAFIYVLVFKDLRDLQY